MLTYLNKRLLSLGGLLLCILLFCACSGNGLPEHGELPQAGSPVEKQTIQNFESDTPESLSGSEPQVETRPAANGSEETRGAPEKNAGERPENEPQTLGVWEAPQDTGSLPEKEGVKQTAKPQETLAQESAIVLTIIYPKEAGLQDLSLSCAFEQGESVLDILIRFGKENKIPVVFSGFKSSGYVEGINGCFEFDYGPESGWVYEVNDLLPQQSAGAYTPKDQDQVRWRYTYSLAEVKG